MTQPSLLDLAPASVADTSLDAYRKLLPTLSKREVAVFMALCEFCDARDPDATGGELAEWMRSLTTSVRPRLTGLEAKGWIEKTPARQSSAAYEGKCHGYRPIVPRAAIERMQKEQHS